MIESARLTQHRFQNALQSVLIMLFMALLLGTCAQLIIGEGAFLIIFFATLFILAIRPQLPTSIVMRLYRATPLSSWEAPELISLTEALTRRAGLAATPSLYYVPSASLNAFTIGSATDSAIAITDGLLRQLSLRELTAVLAHEISHISYHDTRVMGLADTVSRLTMVLAQIGLLLLLFNLPLWLFGVVEISWLGVLILLLAPLLASLLQAALSRTREFAADLGAAELTGDPHALSSALLKIEHPQQGWLQRALFPHNKESAPSALRSHPPTDERIKRLLALTPVSSRYHQAPPIFSSTVIPVTRYVVVTRRPRRHWSGLWY